MRYFIINAAYYTNSKKGEITFAQESMLYPKLSRIREEIRKDYKNVNTTLVRNIIELSKEDYESFCS